MQIRVFVPFGGKYLHPDLLSLSGSFCGAESPCL